MATLAARSFRTRAQPRRFSWARTLETRILRTSRERPTGSVGCPSDRIPHRVGRRAASQSAAMTLQRIAWIVTVAALLVGALTMLLSGYQGYAAVFAAVALSAAINLR